jgi:CheY-like chemotaxis protein
MRIRQVLANLVGNAVKFTETGGVQIAAALQPREGRPRVRWEVTDTGSGLSDAEQARLFAPFVQLDASTTRRHGGSGLGLAICKRLVEGMGGALGVARGARGGSCFWFELDLEPDVAVPGGDTAGAEGCAQFAARVLVAEDNPVNMVVTRKMLALLGVSVSEVRDGRAALERLATEPFDLVLTDLHMPELDGFELARAARAQGLSLPIVAITANVLGEERSRCLAAGMNDMLSKPFKKSDLERVLRAWLPAALTAPAPLL